MRLPLEAYIPAYQMSKFLESLSSEEAGTVLRQLLDKHSELRAEAEQIARVLVSSSSIEDIAEDVHDRITNIALDELNERAGSHSWGYVEPSEASVRE